MTMRVRPRIDIRDARDLLRALEVHTRASERDIIERKMRGSPLPPIYRSGVRYSRRDPHEEWQLPSTTYARGVGDCEDLAGWRAAELRTHGEAARVVVRRTGPGVLHAVVQRENGKLEDPSKRLGMT